MFTTSCYDPSAIVDPSAHKDFVQYFEIDCPLCGKRVRLCVPNEHVDWKSAYDKIKVIFSTEFAKMRNEILDLRETNYILDMQIKSRNMN